MITKFDSPALTKQDDGYPASWHGKVPSRVRMDKTVTRDLPWLDTEPLCAVIDKEYDAWVNRYGALFAIFENGKMLGLKLYEFTVVAWHGHHQQKRCDECGEFVREGSLVVSGIDENKCICRKCDNKHSYCACDVSKRKLIMHDKALVCRICGKSPGHPIEKKA